MENLVLYFFNFGCIDELECIGYFLVVIECFLVYCFCDQFDFEGCEDWCFDGICLFDVIFVGINLIYLIIYYVVGMNSFNDWAVVVCVIWDFYIGVNGWDDVGYNWLIDFNGVLYEGWGDDCLGVYFCGINGVMMGVCMFGDYISIIFIVVVWGILVYFMAWKSCDIGVDLFGIVFYSNFGLQLMCIFGYCDGCVMACFGDVFYL